MINTPMINTPITPDLLRGAIDVDVTVDGLLPHRLPAWARDQYTDPQLSMVEVQPSGVRLMFRTASTIIELDTRPTKVDYDGVGQRPDGVYDLLIDDQLAAQQTVPGGDLLKINFTGAPPERTPGPAGTARFDGLPDRPKDVEIWLPWNEATELIMLRSDAPIKPVASDRPVWLHHGSSISHGSNSDSPTTTWPAVAARAKGVELINLGLGGCALLDPFTARTIRDTAADRISVKIGINLVNADLMRKRAFVPAVHGFLDTIREGHPQTPLLIISPIYCPIHEDTPGPASLDTEAYARGDVRFLATGDPAGVAAGQLTLRVIREQLAAIVAQRAEVDHQLSYLDGTKLYGEGDAVDHPLPDNLHPDPATQQLIGRRFADVAWRSGHLAPTTYTM